jgi:hypothetical protein
MYNFLKNHYRKRYHGVYQHAKKLFAFDLILLFLAIAMMVSSIFLFFWKPSLAGLIDISLSLGTERVKSGEMVHLTIDYTNNSKQTLRDVSLGLRLPEGFIIDRAQTPKEVFSDNSIFTAIKEISAGASGQADLYGQFWIEPKKENRFIANLSYRPDNKNSREQKLSSLISTISDSVLTGHLTMPSSTFSNSLIKFTYTLQNSGGSQVNNISLKHTLDKDAISEKDLSNISLPPGGTKVIEGQFVSPNKSGQFNFSITPQILANNHPILQSPVNAAINVISPQIISSARLLNKTDFAEPSQGIPIEIRWENKSSVTLQNLTLHLAANLPGVVDWKKTAKENGATAEASGLFFDSNTRTSLSNGTPQNADTFTVTIYLLPTFALPQIEHAKLEIYPIVKAQASQTSDQSFSQEGSRLTVPLATDVHFNNIEARYYTAEGDQLGRGPLPPVVGKTTKYWIVVKIINGSNGLEDATFNTSLPEGIELSGKQSTTLGPHIAYNSANRSISWQYLALPPNSQTGLYFEVAVTPGSTQIGKNIQLTNSLSFSATDDFTHKKFNLSHAPISNILNRNDGGYNLGSKVIP